MASTTHAKTSDKKNAEILKKELPPDWEVVNNPEVKKPYYWNRRTNQTTWKFPRAEAEAHKVKVDEHLYQNVKPRPRVKSTDEATPAAQSPKPDKKHSSVPPQTPPPPIGPKPVLEPPPPVGPKPGHEKDSEYSTVSQDWIDKKRSGAQKSTSAAINTTSSNSSEGVEDGQPPPLPPRSELADQLDEALYDLPMVHDDISPSVKTTGSVAVSTNSSKPNSNKSPVEAPSVMTTDPDTTYDVIADVKTPTVDFVLDASSRKSPIDRKTPNNSPLVSKKAMTLPKPSSETLTTSASSEEAAYDVISEGHASKSLTMPASNRRSPSPEYAVVRQSPVLPHNSVKTTAKSDSPAVPSSGEYASVSANVKVEEPNNSEYDLPVTAREKHLRINSPPSPILSNYAKLKPKNGTHSDKQDWKLPADSKKKTSRTVSVDVLEPTSATDSVDKAIKELQKGLDDSGQTKNRVHSMDLSTMEPKKSDDLSIEWDDSDMTTTHVSTIQQSWKDKHEKNLIMRSYEEVKLPDSPSVSEKLRRGWSPRDDSTNEKLPAGWSKVIGEEGVYYWHVKSGRTQWTLPTETVSSDKLAADVDEEFKELHSTLDDLQMHTMNYAAALASSNDSTDHDAPRTFRAMALGWEEVDETELVRGQMVSVVHACIRRITATKGDSRKNAIATGGQGKEVFLQIHGMELRLLDPESSTVLSVQVINKIRVWGIGKENERDFGYIARDPSTQRHKCHVFRCQVPAQAVARALVDNHSKSKKSRSEDLIDDLYMDTNPHDESINTQSGKITVKVDDDHEDAIAESSVTPIPTETESYQRFECTYLGKVETKSAYGIETLIDSLTKLSSEAEEYRWIEVFMDIASSHIKILDKKTEDLIQEHRVRFLSFLGINPKDEKYCGYIVDNGDSQFLCHGFMAEPNTNKMCIALHGACQARFQRVLDSQPQQQLSTPKEERRQTFSFFKKKTSKKQPGPPPPPSKSNEPLYKYTVQLLGSMPVAQSANLDNVKECVQQLTEKFRSSQVKHSTGDFEILPTGINVIGHQKKLFGREKHYSFKNVTYCVKLKNYFAFVYRESSSKCVCHVFAELEVDAATIVCAIQKTIMPLQALNS